MHLTNKEQFFNIFPSLVNDNFVPFFQAVKFVNPSADTDAFEFTRKLHLPVKKTSVHRDLSICVYFELECRFAVHWAFSQWQ
jgi:hypothetical protein